MSNLSAIEEYFADASLWVVLSFKANLSSFEEGDSVPAVVRECYDYVENSIGYVRGSSLGVHLNGKAQVPHWYLHLIVKREGVPKTVFSNASKHRSDYKKKTGVNLDVSMRVQPMSADDVRSNIFAYPLKEGVNFIDGAEYCRLNREFSQSLYDAIVELGTNIYSNACVEQERRDKSERKTVRIRDAVFECIGDRVFYSLDEVLAYVAVNYYRRLDPGELPNWANVRKLVVDVCVYKAMPIPFSELR